MLPSKLAQANPLSHLLQMNSGLQVDFTQLEAVIQARRNAELAVLSLSQIPRAGEMPLVPPPQQPVQLPVPQPLQPQPQAPAPVVEGDDLSSSSSGESEEESVVRPPQKRNPNDLNTAAPVTCFTDFARTPISTKLNNLKLPKTAKGPSVSAPPSALSRQPKVFPSNYLPRDQDVVVDMAHYPNREFQSLVRQSLPNYLTASQPRRKFLISAIFSTVSGNGGSFLRFWGSRQAWAEVEKVHAEKFIAQALQDAASQQGTKDVVNAPSSLKNGIHPNVAAAQSAAPSLLATTEGKTAVVEQEVSRGARMKRSSFSVMPSVKRAPQAPKRASFTALPRANPTNEIPITFRKRPSQSIPQARLDPADRSALSIKFKRPKTTSTSVSDDNNKNNDRSQSAGSPVQPRKVSLETPTNPLEFLSQIAALEDEEGSESEC